MNEKKRLVVLLIFALIFSNFFAINVWANSPHEIEIILTDAQDKQYNSFEVESVGQKTVTYNGISVVVKNLYVVAIPVTDIFKQLTIHTSLTVDEKGWYREYGTYSPQAHTIATSSRGIPMTVKNQTIVLDAYTNDSTLQYMLVTSEKTKDSQKTEYGILFRIGAASGLGPEKAEITAENLKELCIAAQSKDAARYITLDDRYNGKSYSQSGFWADMQAALIRAKGLFVDGDVEKGIQSDVTAAQITAVYEALKAASDGLIPVEQANVTVLYEAVQDSEVFSSAFTYNSENYSAFQTNQAAAKKLLDELFENGVATKSNTASKQDDINKAAADLKESYSGDKMTAEISSQNALEVFLRKAGSNVKGRLMQDISLTGYSPAESFKGVLDGDGYAIIIDSGYKGLVSTNNGIIQNLTISGAELTSISAICNINKGTIENCHNAVNFNNDKDNSQTQTGAICNINDSEGTIRSCYNTGKLSGQYLGGICGQNYGLIENCFNTGLIDAEREAGGIVWRNHNNGDKTTDSLNAKSGIIRNCYNFNVMHHTAGWNSFYGSYIEKNLGPICGDNERASVSVDVKTILNEGTVENGFYLDTVITNKPNGKPLSIALSDIYLAQKKDFQSEGAGTYAGTAIAGWTEKDKSNSIFAYDTDYYVFYDCTNEHFIAVTFDDEAVSAVIDAAKPSEQSEFCSSSAGEEKAFYLVKVPTGTKTVQFTNTETIIDYAAGYTNRYLKAYLQLDHAGTTMGAQASRKFVGTSIQASDVSTILNTVSTICGSDTATYAFVETMLSGTKTESSIVTPGEKTIQVKFRFIGATKSTSGNYDAKTNKDSQYVTWIATRTYSLKDGSSVGDLLKLAIKESGIKTVGENNNYVSGVYAPDVLGNYYLAEFTNGVGSGWMYTVNGKHPSVGLNGYYLKDGDSVIWHYVNDYHYEVSDWFNDPDYPNLGDESTWDPWLKVPDVDPTRNTPTIGVSEEETKKVTTSGSAGSATTASPTEVKLNGKTASVTVTADNRKEILKQAKENKAAEILLTVADTDAKGAEKFELTLDKSFLQSLLKETTAKLVVKTPLGQKTYDREAMQKLVDEAASGVIKTEITKDNVDQIDEEAEKLQKAKDLTASLSLTARSTKTAKKNVKITLKTDKTSAAAIAELKDMGYTVKYKFYRSLKKASKYEAKITKTAKTFTNTKGVKGKKYYYKARVMVYDQTGKLVTYSKLTQCKYAVRTWTK